MADYAAEPVLVEDELHWQAAPAETRDDAMLRPVAAPFSADGGMRLLAGNLGRAILKTSAVAEDRWTLEAPCRIFDDQNQLLAAFKAGELERDVIVEIGGAHVRTPFTNAQH